MKELVTRNEVLPTFDKDPIGELSESVNEFVSDNGEVIAGIASILVLAGALVSKAKKKKEDE